MSGARPTVLLTRSQEENERTAPLFEAAGLNVWSMPGVAIIAPSDWTPVDDAIDRLHEYDGILFTSGNAVTRLIERLRSHRPDGMQAMARLTIAAIGERTADAVEAAGLTVSVVPDIATAEDLSSAIDDSMLRGKRYLFPCSSIARTVLPDALRAAGASVEEVIVYRTVSPVATELDAVRDRLVDGSIRVVAFFSPSAVRNVVQLLGLKCLVTARIAVIGPTTAAAARQTGLEPTVQPVEHTAEALAAAVATMVS